MHAHQVVVLVGKLRVHAAVASDSSMTLVEGRRAGIALLFTSIDPLVSAEHATHVLEHRGFGRSYRCLKAPGVLASGAASADGARLSHMLDRSRLTFASCPRHRGQRRLDPSSPAPKKAFGVSSALRPCRFPFPVYRAGRHRLNGPVRALSRLPPFPSIVAFVAAALTVASMLRV